jgi:hemoglobin/transferrin/lactoferrin receptor protein
MKKLGIMRGALLCSTALTLATGVAAQEDDTFLLDPVELGKSKREVQTDTAVSVTSVGQEEINDRQASTIAELVDSVPGVTLINGATPSGSGINIRGFGANSTFGSDQKVLIQVDGASVGSEELYRIGTQLFTDPELYKEVDVIRGMAGSYEYGSGAVGGVVLLETKDASDFTGGEAGFAARQTLQYNSNGDSLTSSTILAWQPTEDLEFLANFTYRTQNNQKDGSGNTIGNSEFSLPSYLIKGRQTFGQDREHYVEFSLTDTSSSERDVPYDTFATSDAVFGNVDRDTRTKTAVLSYGYNPAGSDLVDLTVTLSYADQQIDQEYVAGSSSCEAFGCGFPFPPGGFPFVSADHQYETTKLLIKNTSLFDTGSFAHEVRSGIEFSSRDRLDASSAPGGTDDRIALFLVDEIDFQNGLFLTPAVRYETQTIGDNTTSYDNSALMGGISALYRFETGFSIFGSAGYTESLPIIDDLGTPLYMTQSEKARSYDIGVSYDSFDVFGSGDNLALKATYYSTNLWDVTSYTTTVAGTQYPITNINVQGLELEASYAMATGMYVDLNANVQRGDFVSPTAPAGSTEGYYDGIPADQLRMTLGKRFENFLDLSWEVVANKRMERSSIVSPGNVTHNVRATYRPDYGYLSDTEIRVGIENLFDKDYTPHLATRKAPGRNVKLTLAKTF